MAYLPTDADLTNKKHTISELGYSQLVNIYSKTNAVAQYLEAVEKKLLYLILEAEREIERVKPVFKDKRAGWTKNERKEELLHQYIAETFGPSGFKIKTVNQIKKMSEDPDELNMFIEPIVNKVILALDSDKREDVRNLSKP